MKIAVFADVHGKVLLPFVLSEQYRLATGNRIDLILQCGDVGIFPDITQLDKATIRHAQKDEDELGFSQWCMTENKSIRAFLDQLDTQMICVRGNHEDHDYLDQLEQKYSTEAIFPVDIYQRIFVCKSGLSYLFHHHDETIKVMGIGRIGNVHHRNEKQYIQDYERIRIKQFIKAKQSPDVLITHDRDLQPGSPYGSIEILEAVSSLRCPYHFYGHTGHPLSISTHANGNTKSVKIKELEFDPTGVLPSGCMIVLDKTNQHFHLEVVEDKILRRVSKFDWLMHIPGLLAG